MPETMEKMKLFRRFLENVEIEVRREKTDTVMTFAASSESPVERSFGMEVLSHEQGAVRLDRAKRGAMPLLFNHNMGDPIGMIKDARLESGRLMVDAQLFDTARGREVQAMIAGGLRNVSIMYRSYVIEENKKSEQFTVKDWEPFETSIVSVPADASVGIGRSADSEFEVRIVRASEPAKAEEIKMPDQNVKADNEIDTALEQHNHAARAMDAARGAGKQAQERAALDIEKARKNAIITLCKTNKLDDSYRDMWIGQGLSLNQVADEILSVVEERSKSNPQSPASLGLSHQETQRFSLARAIVACRDQNWTKAGYELECSRSIAQKMGCVPEPTKFFVPFEVLERPINRQKRDLTVGTAGAGGFLVETENVGFIEMLRNRSVAFRMGARRLSGLQGNVTVPRQSAAATAVWLANEASTSTESQQTFVQLSMTPKTVSAYTEVSRLLLLQSSPSAEAIVTDDLAQVVATAADLGVINGSGAAGQPTGIIGTSGVGAVTGTTLAYAGILEYQTDVATANVIPSRGGYVTTPSVASLLMQRVKFTSTASPLWEGNVWDGSMAGFTAMSSNQMPAASMIFGDWEEAVVAEWSVLSIEVNPYANFQAGIIGVRAMYSMDVGVRRPFAFSVTASGIT